ARIGVRETTMPIVMPVVAETSMGEAVLGKVAAGEMGGPRGGTQAASVSCCERVSYISNGRGVPGEAMGAKTMIRKPAAAHMKAPSSDMETEGSRVQATEMSHAAQAHATEAHSAKMHAPQAHAAKMHTAEAHTTKASHAHAANAPAAKMHPAQTPTTKMHSAAAEVAASTKSPETSRLCVFHQTEGQRQGEQRARQPFWKR